MSNLTIGNVIGTTMRKIENKEHSIWIPICIRNQYYSKTNLKNYLDYSLAHTKDDVAILIVDSLQAINSQVLDNMDKNEAHNHAMRIGDQYLNLLLKYKGGLSDKAYDKFKIFRWDEASKTKQYHIAYSAIEKEFDNNELFQDTLVEVVKLNLKDRVKDVNRSGLLQLSKYLIGELALFFKGAYLGEVKYGDMFLREKVYDLLLYPEDSAFKLFDDIQTGVSFQSINERYWKYVKEQLSSSVAANTLLKDKFRMAQLTAHHKNYKAE